MARIYKIGVPVKQIVKAIESLYEYKSAIERFGKMESELGTAEKVQRERGNTGLEERAKAIETLNSFRAFCLDSVQNTLKEQRAAAIAEIDAQITPNGKYIMGENAADFAVLEHGLVDTPDQLDRVLDKHNNSTFWTVAAKYAAQRGWEGFDFTSKENTMREYIKTAFDGLEAAAANLDGYSALQYLKTPDEYRRMANAYGIGEEFEMSGGGNIGETIASASEGGASA